MSDYYRHSLSAARLEAVYRLATGRIEEYLRAELDYVCERINPDDEVLELGCGYGRAMTDLSRHARSVVGIDNSLDNLRFGREYLAEIHNCRLVLMDAGALAFADASFDLVVCLQNGISAFGLDPIQVMAEATRVARPGGRCIFTSYSDRIWDARLEWFERQAETGLLGRIDYDRTGNGVIVCEDGFRAETFSVPRFESVASRLGLRAEVRDISGLFVVCEWVV